MADTDLLPAADPHATTRTLKRKTMTIALKPETKVVVQLGGIIASVVCLVLGTIFVWTIKQNGEQALAELKAFREETAPKLRQVDRLWWDYEQRVASGRAIAPSAAAP